MPLRHVIERSEAAAVQREAEQMERSLIYVVWTRACKAAPVTAHGKPSRLLEGTGS